MENMEHYIPSSSSECPGRQILEEHQVAASIVDLMGGIQFATGKI